MMKKGCLTIELYHPNEFIQLWDDMTHKLKHGLDAIKFPSICYLLRDEEHNEIFPHKVISEHLNKNAPQQCVVVDTRRINVRAKSNDFCPPSHIEGTNVGYFYVWEYPKLLDKLVSNSGFYDVRKWLDSWMDQKKDFEYDREYSLWLIKIYYPHIPNTQIQIQNNATQLIPIANDDAKISYA